ncbi:MAG: serine/threonine protein kinase [Planctomycetes bacterium]|nr:serine/threonine protein kinase [Planctomycetota bacterium]
MDPTHRTPDPAALLHAAMSGGGDSIAPWTPPALAELAGAFPELAITGLVGQGGMAAVYRAEQTRLGRTVALKVLRQDLAAKPQFVDRFLREARALAALSNPHVLAIFDFGERQGFCYLLTEFVDGANLRELMRLGTLSPAEVLRIVPQICAGLHFAHQHGVVHRDIKPENVLVDRAGLVKLADFGLAKLAGEPPRTPLTGPTTVFGTPHYMAPEQWQGSGSVDHRADIYSLGVVLYELLTGKLPVGTYAPASRQPGVPAGIDQVVQRTLQPEPEQRYQSAHEVQRDLERQQPATPPAVTPTPAPAPRGVLRWLVAAVLIAAACAAPIAWLVHAQVQADFAKRDPDEQLRQAEQLLAAIQGTVADGKPWTGALPEIAPPQPRVSLPNWLRLGPFRWALVATGMLVWLCLLAAFLRARHPAVPRWQYVAALVLVTSPLTVGLAAGQWAIAMRYAQPTAGVLPFVAMFVIAAAAVAGIKKAWQLAGNRRQPLVDRLPRALPLTIGLLALGIAGCGVYMATNLQVDAWSRREIGPIVAMRLAGMTRQQVLTRMGPPLTISRSPGAMIWGYRGLDGQERSDAVQFTQGQVTMVTTDAVLLVPNPTPTQAPWLGQTVTEVIAALGPATDRSTSTDPNAETVLSWRNEVAVTVSADGIVVGVHR